jgi:hypothetical protein
MKLKDLLNESATDIVARFYKEAGEKTEQYYNPEVVKYKEKNAKYYDEHFKQWFSEEVVPVFTKPVTKPQPEYTNHPKQGKLQSPGYRGFQYALAAAGLPYNHDVQAYAPNASKLVATQAIDNAKNAWG